MKLLTMICHLDGTQELCETEVPDDWFAAPPESPAEPAAEDSAAAAGETSAAQ